MGKDIDFKIYLKLREIRKKRYLSKNELSKISGISRSYITELEEGKYSPSLVIMVKLSRALNCSIEDLYFIN